MIGTLLAAGASIAEAMPATTSDNAREQYQDTLRLVDIWLDAQSAFDRVPGLSAEVVVGEQLVWKGGYGTIDKDRKVAARADTIYGICSISKLFTSVSIMQLWETGQLTLDPIESVKSSSPRSAPRSVGLQGHGPWTPM